MKKLIYGIIVLILAGASAYYFELGTSPQTKRDRYIAKAKAFSEAAKTKEAIIEWKNALKMDPAHAESHYDLGLEFLKSRDFRAAYNELVRAKDLDPKLIKARHQLGVMYLLSNNLPRAKEELQNLQAQSPDAQETRYLAAQVAVAEKDPDRALK